MQNSKVYDIRERTMIFSLDIIKLLETMPNSYISSVIGKQLLRSATSIGANIIEAQSASSKREFQNFYSIALKSANETKYWLDLLKRSGKCASSNVDRLIEEVGEISKIIAKSILTIKCR